MEAESQPFLNTTETDEKPQNVPSQRKRNLKSILTDWALWFGVFVFINALALMSIAAWVAHRPSPSCASIRGQELRGLKLRYVSTKFSDYTQTPFFQDPGPATDEAWEDLMGGMLIRVTAEDLNPANQSSIILPQDGNQLAWLGVYHDLHCINTLRRWIHRDYYHPNLTGAEFAKFQSHTSHCLDMLRQTVQCHADAYLMTFRWTDSEPKPAFNPAMPRRTCVDFDLLRQSLKPRFVGLEEIQGLKNPLMNQGM